MCNALTPHASCLCCNRRWVPHSRLCVDRLPVDWNIIESSVTAWTELLYTIHYFRVYELTNYITVMEVAVIADCYLISVTSASLSRNISWAFLSKNSWGTHNYWPSLNVIRTTIFPLILFNLCTSLIGNLGPGLSLSHSLEDIGTTTSTSVVSFRTSWLISGSD